MQFNPWMILLIFAPTAVLAAWLFLMVHEEQRLDREEQQVEHRLERQKFERDFEQAWNNGSIPQDSETQDRIDQTRKELAEIRKKQDAAEKRTDKARKEVDQAMHQQLDPAKAGQAAGEAAKNAKDQLTD